MDDDKPLSPGSGLTKLLLMQGGPSRQEGVAGVRVEDGRISVSPETASAAVEGLISLGALIIRTLAARGAKRPRRAASAPSSMLGFRQQYEGRFAVCAAQARRDFARYAAATPGGARGDLELRLEADVTPLAADPNWVAFNIELASIAEDPLGATIPGTTYGDLCAMDARVRLIVCFDMDHEPSPVAPDDVARLAATLETDTELRAQLAKLGVFIRVSRPVKGARR